MTTSEAIIDSGMYLNSSVSLMAGALMGNFDKADELPQEVKETLEECHMKLVLIHTDVKGIIKRIVSGK